jgi:hypothetical protein
MKLSPVFQISSFFVVGLIVLVVAPADGHAYIDPGTGANFVGSIVPLLGAFTAAISALFVKVFWGPLRSFVARLRVK